MLVLAELPQARGLTILLWPVYRPVRCQGCQCVLAPSVPVWLHAMPLVLETRERRPVRSRTVCLAGM
ncbi:Uncharacterized protein HZ326_26145 [Fusarium oxysporum f. sp. albedinis]|nr:Uncharacterized protein HZ326_26145 [Fusarium oxysporum f. sp. albedinis]